MSLTADITTCMVCTDPFVLNNPHHTRTRIICTFCSYSACRLCCQTYLLTVSAPQCMNCHNAWLQQVLVQYFSRHWLQTALRPHRSKYLFDRERALLPETMVEIKRIDHRTELKEKSGMGLIQLGIFRGQLRNLRAKFESNDHELARLQQLQQPATFTSTSISATINSVDTDTVDTDTVDTDTIIARLNDNRTEYREQIDDISRKRKRQLDELTQITQDIRNTNTNATPNAREASSRGIVHACPGENCRGFLDSEWTCSLCKVDVCSKCHEITGSVLSSQHVCNPDNVATAALLSKDTRPCPKCATGIYKIDGCDQMWCTQCHTGFSWRTGLVETRVHNPHFFQWVREQREKGNYETDLQQAPAADGGCHREIHMFRDSVRLRQIFIVWFLSSGARECRTRLNHYLSAIDNVMRAITHIKTVILPSITEPDNGTPFEQNLDLRIMYLRGEISEERFRRMIGRREFANAKKTEVGEVLNTFTQMTAELIVKFTHECDVASSSANGTITHWEHHNPATFLECFTLCDYVNNCLYDIAVHYHSKIFTHVDFFSGTVNIHASIQSRDELYAQHTTQLNGIHQLLTTAQQSISRK